MKVSIIGAAGRVGLPLALVLADSGHQVSGIDLNTDANRIIMDGTMPFCEDGAEELLSRALAQGRLKMTSEFSSVEDSDVIIIVIGTPIDENLNPRLDHLLRCFQEIREHLKDQLVILRSTVSPGTTDAVRKLIGLEEIVAVSLVYAPERVMQGKGIEEMRQLPHIIGAYSSADYERAARFFHTFSNAPTISLDPVEAELGKLITNMARYVGFALANEFHLICQSFGANACRVIDACNTEYPRLNLAVPGPNVGGPCLYKDGWYLIDHIPFGELISTAFRINEAMTMQILSSLKSRVPGGRIGILGMTFKADSDDTRNSLAFKLRRQLQFRGYDAICVETHVSGFGSLADLAGADAVILMAAHKEFRELSTIVAAVANPECWLVDLWGFWPEMRHRSRNGYFQVKEVQWSS